MKSWANFKRFLRNESGAVTVDWVVLTAAIVGLGIAVIASVSTGTNSLGDKIQAALAGMELSELASAASETRGLLGTFFQNQANVDQIVGILNGFVESGDIASVHSLTNAALLAAGAGGDGMLSAADAVDAAGYAIEALENAGEDVTEYQASYDAAYAACEGEPSCQVVSGSGGIMVGIGG